MLLGDVSNVVKAHFDLTCRPDNVAKHLDRFIRRTHFGPWFTGLPPGTRMGAVDFRLLDTDDSASKETLPP